MERVYRVTIKTENDLRVRSWERAISHENAASAAVARMRKAADWPIKEIFTKDTGACAAADEVKSFYLYRDHSEGR